MVKRKRTLPIFIMAILIAVFLCTTVFVGCSSSSDDGGGSGTTTTLTGTVTDSTTDVVITDATVKLGENETTTDSSGIYTFSGITTGTYTLSVTKTGYREYQVSITIVEGSNTKNISLTASETQTGSLSGTVKNGEAALDGVLVELQNVGSYTTAADGAYSFSQVTYGNYTITATKSGYDNYSSSVTISASTNTHDISISTNNDLPAPEEGKGHILGYVTDSSGTALYNVQCTLYTLSGKNTGKVPIVYTDANGRYVFLNVNPGSYQVVFYLGGYNIPYVNTTVTSGEVTEPDDNTGTPINDEPIPDTPSTTARQYLYGGNNVENSYSIVSTSDGGYIAAGYTASSASGDVSGASKGAGDIWIVKMNSIGAIEWEKNYGGNAEDEGYSIVQTSDGGYIVGGNTYSSANGDVSGANHGSSDIWIVKLDNTGAITWEKNYGGDQTEYFNSIRQTTDGGYIVVGSTNSSANGDVTGASNGDFDVWIVKLDNAGAITWQKNYGGSASDRGLSVIQTTDTGYMVAANTESSATGDVTGANNGAKDIWLLKLDNAGAITWQKNYGGSGDDGFQYDCIKQTTDGGYIGLASTASSATGDVSGVNKGAVDYWAVKLDNAGSITWEKNYGGSGNEVGTSVYKTADGGYWLIGVTTSSANGDVTGTNNGVVDGWVVKINSTGTIQWQYNYGGDNQDFLTSAAPADDGFFLSGYSQSSQTGTIDDTNNGLIDSWIIQLTSQGTMK